MIWLHYVGKSDQFLANALQQGVTRRVSPQDARRMEFGDEVLLAAWNKGEPYVFAQFVISQVLLRDETAQEIISQLRMRGLAELLAGDPIHVAKECGTFTIGGGCVVTCGMGEVVESSIYAAGLVGERPWFMVGGSITALFNDFYIDPGYTKVQGFTEVGTGEENEEFAGTPRVLLEVRGYKTN